MMKFSVVNGVLLSSLTIPHRGNRLTLKSVIIDTGSAHTWVNLDAVEDVLDVVPEVGDHIITAFGIGEAGRCRINFWWNGVGGYES